MPSSVLFAATAMLASSTYAYTQVNFGPPFMTKNIDPIVFPGEFGKSHLHSFFGSDAVTASTNSSAELLNGCSLTENKNDMSVYWIPTPLYTKDSGKTYEPIPVFRFSAYYNLGETPAEVAMPQNLKMLAGDAKAKTASESPADAKASWFCEGDNGISLDANGFPSKTCSTHLQQLLFFPQCVNEQTLETAYKSRSHGTPNWCPQGFKSMPQLRFSIRYDLRKVLPDGWSGTAPFKLASGNAYSSHGDIINGWTEEGAKNMIATTQSKTEFMAVDGKLGKNGEKMSCKPADAEPGKGTSDYAESVAALGKRSVPGWGWASRARVAHQA
ncbi:hypothetical protein CC80DRAFT_542834 [Byssothecium circinans]|uniref:DUF1996 domain-containing protein n=1 Tax=Byssothecium circinans TaxID=147558 RepID=A0A6A5UCQ0_9PLEO|nr:hypothetical protein CC80DRAFT_542834 [Byssothecium circinans]